jgi:hypothetical protein
VFDALFSVLAEGGTRGELDDYVYRAIVYILGMEADRYLILFILLTIGASQTSNRNLKNIL